ncbi:hypothetical protein GWK47_010136 [Chionoecetes opilio]|uniref:Uncharacterized protein n=1 Tax=Chionoecetes opilio TaxID=41210 RepID=A0A8J4Y2N5_CHIOP|nr:hypothetical protein GWK47_010136 [Chionoecetes opilio]
MRERKTFPAPSPLPGGVHVRHVGGEHCGDRRPRRGRRRGGRAIQGQERPFRTTLAAQPLCGQAARNPEGGPGREAQKRERPLEEGLWDSTGPERKARDPEPLKTRKAHPDWDDEDPGGHPHGGEPPGLPLPTRRRAPTNTAGPLLEPPGPRTVPGAGVENPSDGGGD